MAVIAVAGSVVLSSAVIFVAVKHDLVGGVDSSLQHRATLLAKRRSRLGLVGAVEPAHRHSSQLGAPPVLAQVVSSSGAVIAREQAGLRLPIPPGARVVAAGRMNAFFTDTSVAGTPVRMLVTGFGPGLALQVVRPVSDLESEIERLGIVLVAMSLGGVLLALLLGAAVAGVALRPVRRLTEAAERVASTRDLAQEIPIEGHDELARLAASINTMLDALELSQRAQRQLVADASHELGTPLTALRTNVEVLADSSDLDPCAREQLIADLIAQFDGMSALVGDLVELAREETPEPDNQTDIVPLHDVVSAALQRAERSYPALHFAARVRPAFVEGVGRGLDRMVTNLLDNAAKWSPDGGSIEVSLAVASLTPVADPAHLADPGAGTAVATEVVLRVRDHGPGIAPEDLPHIFDRFYRGRGARTLPGSGLGLAIVKRVAEAHDATVLAEVAPGGGTLITVRLPVLPEPQSESAPG
ncbi:MAG: sensor histidine kinase [Acidimicrobiales bacterium]